MDVCEIVIEIRQLQLFENIPVLESNLFILLRILFIVTVTGGRLCVYLYVYSLGFKGPPIDVENGSCLDFIVQ